MEEFWHYLGVLVLPKDFDEALLKKAYRREAMKWHPDKNPGDAYAEERLKLVNEAYEYFREVKNFKSQNQSSREDYKQPPKQKTGYYKQPPIQKREYYKQPPEQEYELRENNIGGCLAPLIWGLCIVGFVIGFILAIFIGSSFQLPIDSSQFKQLSSVFLLLGLFCVGTQISKNAFVGLDKSLFIFPVLIWLIIIPVSLFLTFQLA